MGCTNAKKKSILARGDSKCKGPELEACLTSLKDSKEASVAGLESTRGRVSGDEAREREQTPDHVGLYRLW